jgi:hypothetical protein
MNVYLFFSKPGRRITEIRDVAERKPAAALKIHRCTCPVGIASMRGFCPSMMAGTN